MSVAQSSDELVYFGHRGVVGGVWVSGDVGVAHGADGVADVVKN